MIALEICEVRIHCFIWIIVKSNLHVSYLKKKERVEEPTYTCIKKYAFLRGSIGGRGSRGDFNSYFNSHTNLLKNILGPPWKTQLFLWIIQKKIMDPRTMLTWFVIVPAYADMIMSMFMIKHILIYIELVYFKRSVKEMWRQFVNS